MDATMKQYAEVGAGIRLRELESERQRILVMFPSLNGNSSSEVHPPTVAADPVANQYPEPGVRARKRMSQKQKQAISKRMRAYWREKRKGSV